MHQCRQHALSKNRRGKRNTPNHTAEQVGETKEGRTEESRSEVKVRVGLGSGKVRWLSLTICNNLPVQLTPTPNSRETEPNRISFVACFFL